MKMNLKKMVFNVVGGFLVGTLANQIFKDKKTSEEIDDIFEESSEMEVTEEVEEV